MKRRADSGYTFVEVLGVLGIIGMVAASSGMLVGSIMDRYRKNRVQDDILTLQKVVSQRYVADGNYLKVSEQTLINENLIPRYMTSGGNIVQPYGNVILSAGGMTYKIRFDGLPMAVCVALGLMNWVYTDSSDLVSIKINDKTYEWPINKSHNAADALPLNTTQVAAICKRENNEITWEFQ